MSHNEENLDNEIETLRNYSIGILSSLRHNEENLDNEIETVMRSWITIRRRRHNEENLDNEIETGSGGLGNVPIASVTTRRISITRLKRGPKGPGLIRNDSHNEENLDNEIETSG